MELSMQETDTRFDEAIEAAMKKYYGGSENQVDKFIQDITEGEVDLTNVIGQQLGGGGDGGEVEVEHHQ